MLRPFILLLEAALGFSLHAGSLNRPLDQYDARGSLGHFLERKDDRWLRKLSGLAVRAKALPFSGWKLHGTRDA
jgi:hypothetical protein